MAVQPFFQVFAGVLQGNRLVPYLFIICLTSALCHALDLHIECGFTLKQRRSSHYPAIYIKDADYADDMTKCLMAEKVFFFLLCTLQKAQRRLVFI